MTEVLKPTAEQRDSLHILPLCMLPIETVVLRRASLIKNSRLETALEFFKDKESGSGQLTIKELPDYLQEVDHDALERDIAKLRRLEQMPSFDVYSCRISLRALGIEVNDEEYLKLSDEMLATLSARMQEFTRPLIAQVFGAEIKGGEDASDLIGMLRNPDKEEALRRLNMLAAELQVQVSEIPRFIEDYGDIFLSLAYFRKCLDEVVPVLDEFMPWVKELMETWMIRNDRPKHKLLANVVSDLSDISGSITGRFESFDRKTQDFWSDVSAARFAEVRKLITDHHVTVGGVLCGLTMKMTHWRGRFTKENPGGPQARLEFIISEILPGLDRIKRLEQRAAGNR